MSHNAIQKRRVTMPEYLVTVVYHNCDVYETYLVKAKSPEAIEANLAKYVDKVVASSSLDRHIELGEGPYLEDIEENV